MSVEVGEKKVVSGRRARCFEGGYYVQRSVKIKISELTDSHEVAVGSHGLPSRKDMKGNFTIKHVADLQSDHYDQNPLWYMNDNPP